MNDENDGRTALGGSDGQSRAEAADAAGTLDGIERMLERLRREPRHRVLGERIATLLMEAPDSTRKVDLVLRLAATVCGPFPREALRLAYAVYEHDPLNESSLELMVRALQTLGRHGKAAVAKNELAKVRAARSHAGPSGDAGARPEGAPYDGSSSILMPSHSSDWGKGDVEYDGPGPVGAGGGVGPDATALVAQPNTSLAELQRIASSMSPRAALRHLPSMYIPSSELGACLEFAHTLLVSLELAGTAPPASIQEVADRLAQRLPFDLRSVILPELSEERLTRGP